ncbi:MAG: nuclear transport factor 2 family protein [bacterium]
MIDIQLEKLMQQLQRFADEGAIKSLQYQYANLMDEGYHTGIFPSVKIAELWVEDGVWDAGEFGRYEGRAAIERFFAAHAEEVSFSTHHISNEVIAIDGDAATCDCLILAPWTQTLDGKTADHWTFGAYHNRFLKIDDRWYFSELKTTIYKNGKHA